MSQAVKEIMPNWAKAYARSTIFKYREATWSRRSLPNFIIIGAQKSGTTSLFGYLSQHPQLCPSSKKEVHFFDGGMDPRVDNFKKGMSWYRAHFPLRKNMSTDQKTFEASPLYIFNPLVPQRIANLAPNVKIIVLLRNPTERAISQFFHEKRLGFEPLTIDEALQKEESRMESSVLKQDYKSEAFIHHSYKSRGLYKSQLERYFKYFSREQILIMNSDDFFAKPGMCLKQIFGFVGVDQEYKVSNLTPRNAASNKTIESKTLNVYDYLNSFFKPHNKELYDMLGENYGW